MCLSYTWPLPLAGQAELARSQQKVDSLQKLARGLSAENKVCWGDRAQTAAAAFFHSLGLHVQGGFSPQPSSSCNTDCA